MQKNTIYVGINPFDSPVFDPQLTPDTYQFRSFPVNLAILTKYGRWIYILHGNQQRCSSFFATIGTIVNKLQMSFGSETKPAKLKSIKQIGIKGSVFSLYSLKRQNFMYVCWVNSSSKIPYHQLTINTMIDFVHYQLTSCLTGKVNDILQQNQTYDPSGNFGKGRAMQNFLYYGIQNGLNSLPILFNAVPILPLPNTTRQSILSIIKDQKQEGVIATILMTTNHLVCLSKRKSVEIQVKDILLFFNLIQTQSLLCKTQNWFPICLPGLEVNSMLFCYLNYIDHNLILVMIADQTDIFPSLSQFMKYFKKKLAQSGLLERVNSSAQRQLINDPTLQRMSFTKHFVIKYKNPTQMVMSSGQYFGKQLHQAPISDNQFQIYKHIYSQLYHHSISIKSTRKQVVHVQTFGSSNKFREQKCQCKQLAQYLGGYYDQGLITIFFIASPMAELQDTKTIINSLLSYIKEDNYSIFISKYN